MVAIDSPRTAKAKKKKFAFVTLSLALVAVLFVVRSASGDSVASSSRSERTTKTTSNLIMDGNEQQQTPTSGQKPIRQISLLGERNSGTRWTYQHLSECFNHSIAVERHLTRYKHWFQYRNDTAYPHDTLVIAQFRNPYDWLKAMQRVPHHAPAHLSQDWKPFLTIPWTTPRLGADIEMGKTITKANNDTDTTPCQQNFIYQDIVSCVKHPLPPESYNHKLRFSEDTPFYEMRIDGSGEPYANIMEMRSAKIENMLGVQDYPGVAAVWAVQYEYLLQRGTQHLLKRVSEWTGVEPKCKAYEPQLRRERPMEAEFVKHVTKYLNWETEKLIGYGKFKQRPTPVVETTATGNEEGTRKMETSTTKH